MDRLNETTFKQEAKSNPKDKIEVEVGDSKQPDFKPQFKIMRWNNEVNFSMRAEEKVGATVKIEDEKVKYITPEYEVHQYSKPEAGEDGGFEFEWVLKSKPSSNILTATIQTKGLDFCYQPIELTPQEISMNATRPENVRGSYAVYHKTNKHNTLGGKDYKTGKAFHIYRPEAVDANGSKTWCQLDIDEQNGILTVTVPQNYLDESSYPVVVDPTFGYTSVGSGQLQANGVGKLNANFVTAPASGTLTSITIYHRYNSGFGASTNYNYAFYTGTISAVQTFLASGAGGVIDSSITGNWLELAVSASITNGNTYWIVENSSVVTIDTLYYDLSRPASEAVLNDAPGTYNTYPDNPTGGAYVTTFAFSMYATYSLPDDGGWNIALV